MKEQYVSQLGQDKFIDDVFRKQEGLIYLDCGAHNGKDFSNTYFLEKERNWMEKQLIEQEKEQKLKMDKEKIFKESNRRAQEIDQKIKETLEISERKASERKQVLIQKQIEAN